MSRVQSFTQKSFDVPPNLELIYFAKHMLETARTESARTLFKQYLNAEIELAKQENALAQTGQAVDYRKDCAL